MYSLRNYGLIITLVFFTATAQADWVLDGENSSLNFVSVKKDKIGEVNHFKTLSGEITNEGKASVTIDLASVETNIDVRNERIKNILLEVDAYPKAKVMLKLDAAQLMSLAIGERRVVPVNLTVLLHGKRKEMMFDVIVVGLVGGSLMVLSLQPIILNAFDFGLDVGISKLIEITKLPSIDSAVPVTFNLVFKAK
ncbi:MAG: hypothetical protein A6F71_04415 [Cycloclasticus sp. symbiont of Poecilosclerida sp. M]|nr:MAG: hypothetical protein A6F71_04415 [Cycloclasticus sp. symbiont of Poecilosclerida sp. M]